MTPFSMYLQKLLRDDEALVAFLENPIKAVAVENAVKKDGKPVVSDEYTEEPGNYPDYQKMYKTKDQAECIKKTDRAILRRVLVSASTNTPNGYAVIRTAASYRRAIEMLHNILVTEYAHGSSMPVEEHSRLHTEASSLQKEDDAGIPPYRSFTLFVYTNGYPGAPSLGSPFANTYTFKTIVTPVSTVKNVLDAAVNGRSSIDGYTTDSTDKYVESITIDGQEYTGAPSKQQGNPFWFYSFDRHPFPTARNAHPDPREPVSGDILKSFSKATVSSFSSVHWQIIAPTGYGYGKCNLGQASDDEVYKKVFAGK